MGNFFPPHGTCPRGTLRKLAKALSAGALEADACASVGLDMPTYEAYYDDDPVFRRVIDAAKAHVMIRAAGAIRVASVEDWRAAEAMLKRAGQDGELARLKGMTTDG